MIAVHENHQLRDNKLNNYLKEGCVVAFTDGSYNTETQQYSYGGCVITPTLHYYEFYDRGSKQRFAAPRNIAGELLAVLFVLNKIWQSTYRKIIIFYDYVGIEKWATHEWDAHSEVAICYQQIMVYFLKRLDIRFYKIKSHSGNYYNDRADELAKLGGVVSET